MAAQTWTLACMWLALGQTPNTASITNQRALSIPVTIQEARRADFKELILYASNDQGRTWQQVATMPPTQNAFAFNAPIDGTYWLRVAFLNRQNKQEPENIYQGPPDQKIVIDTLKPLIRLGTPQRLGDDLTVSWELQEDNPDWTTFRLEYQPKDGGTTWTPIQANAGLTGQARFRATTPGAITVRLSMKDQAGNQGLAVADAAGTVTTTAYVQPPTPMNATPAPSAPILPGVPVAPPPAPLKTDATPLLPPPPASEGAKLPAPPVEAPRTFPANPAPAAAPWHAPGAKNDADKIVATSSQVVPPVAAPTPSAPAQRALPPLQYVNHPEVTIEYELARVGPSGVGSIDLWWTQNDGQTWELYAQDPEGKSGTVKNGIHKRTLDLPGDGMYGFRLVVKSKAGLGKAPPRAGDVPDIRIEVDTTAPEANLYAPTPDSQKPNTLLLKWAARDNNLASTITLEWAAKREGPWHLIAQPLANTGKHSWSLPEGLPVQVYLRLRARDLAGNESIAATAEPQLVDLSEPEGRLLNVSASPR